jgi:hypothetical protein
MIAEVLAALWPAMLLDADYRARVFVADVAAHR